MRSGTAGAYGLTRVSSLEMHCLFQGDGEDDTGINGVKVQLVTPDQYKSNVGKRSMRSGVRAIENWPQFLLAKQERTYSSKKTKSWCFRTNTARIGT